MECALIELDLVGYHLGTLDDEARRAVEEHLPGCAGCVRAFVQFKRVMDAGGGERPSEMARLRLRRAVQAEVSAGRRVARVVVPLVAAAAVVLLALGAAVHWPAAGTPPISPALAPAQPAEPTPLVGAPEVDTARGTPVSLTVL